HSFRYYPLFSIPLPPLYPFTLFPYTTLFRSMIQFTGEIHIKMGEGVLDIRFQPEITNVACENTDDLQGNTAQIDIEVSALVSLQDRKSTRLNSSHVSTSYAVFCLK